MDVEAVIGRRTFLKTAATATAALSVPFLARFAYSEESPDPLKEALQQAKAQGKPALAILIPNSALAVTIVNDLSRLLASEDAAVRRTFCEGVFVCLAANETAKSFPSHPADGRMLCLDSDGKVAEERGFAAELFRGKFVEATAGLLHGKNNERLRSCAENQRKMLGDALCGQFDGAMARLADTRFQTREAASKELLEIAPRATALLALAQLTNGDPEARGRIGEIFSKLFAAAPADKPGPRCPHGFGVVRGRWTRFFDACPGCGMGMISPLSRSFLNALTGTTR